MIDKFNAEYIAGGAAQNTARVAQVISCPYIINVISIMKILADFVLDEDLTACTCGHPELAHGVALFSNWVDTSTCGAVEFRFLKPFRFFNLLIA